MDLILSYYGFEELVFPTLEELGERFDLRRQGVQQIIKARFRQIANVDDLPTTRQIFRVIESKRFISVAELNQQLLHDGLISENINIYGVLRLARAFNFCKGYDVYNSDLDLITRADAVLDGPTYLIESTTLAELQAHRSRARTLPGLLGLATFKYLESYLGVDSSRVIQLIRSSPKACVIEHGEDEWYVFEDRKNTLVNACEKIFSLAQRYDIRVLSRVLANLLRRRGSKYHPNEAVIEKWIEQSGKFMVDGAAVRFFGERSALTRIETDALSYLDQHPVSGYPPFRDHLLQLGYNKPLVDKTIVSSPIVYVDKSAGRKGHVHRSVVNVGSIADQVPDSHSRYQLFKNRLTRLLNIGTDANIETTARREQGLLREWLFSGKSIDVCAICGEKFSTKALVVAHKKKRAFCTEAERVDPYIVFPLCNFGCDFLYEHDIVGIANGQVQVGKLPKELTADRERAVALAGRRVPAEWLNGPSGYFRRD